MSRQITSGFFSSKHFWLLTASSLLFVCLLNIGCGKKETINIEGVTDYSFRFSEIQANGDTYLNPISTDWNLTLKEDSRFSLALGTTTCRGTYTWRSVDEQIAWVSFTITEWNDPAASTALAQKLQRILQSINTCTIYKPPFSGLTISGVYAAQKVLGFSGSAGNIQTFR